MHSGSDTSVPALLQDVELRVPGGTATTTGVTQEEYNPRPDELDIYIQEFTPLLSRSISFCEVADIATSANGFCEGFMAFFAKFARTLAKFARIGLRYLGQPVPAVRKTAKVCLPE